MSVLNYVTQNIYKEFTYTTSAALIAAISTAKPGAVLKLTTTVTPFLLNLSEQKPGVGIDIVLPADQIVRLQLVNCRGIRIHRGTYDAIYFVGNYTTEHQNSDAIYITGSDKCGIYAAHIMRGRHGVQISDSRDCEILHSNLGLFWADTIRPCKGLQRFRMYDIYGEDLCIYKYTFKWRTDGGAPVDGAANSSGGGYTSSDGNHYDAIQSNDGYYVGSEGYGVEDITIDTMNISTLGQGIVTFGSARNPPIRAKRFVVKNSKVLTAWSWSFNIEGTDVGYFNNEQGPHPIVNSRTSGVVMMALGKFNNDTQGTSGARARAGGNINTTGYSSGTFSGPSGISLTGPENGDSDFVWPTLPNMSRPPWSPEYTRPGYITNTTVPTMVTPPLIYWGTVECYNNAYTQVVANPSISSNRYLSARPGHVMGFTGYNYETQWRLGSQTGTILGTGRVLDCQGLAAGNIIHLGMRATGDTGPYIFSPSVQLAA